MESLPCPHCDGTGLTPSQSVCDKCEGYGELNVQVLSRVGSRVRRARRAADPEAGKVRREAAGQQGQSGDSAGLNNEVDRSWELPVAIQWLAMALLLAALLFVAALFFDWASKPLAVVGDALELLVLGLIDLAPYLLVAVLVAVGFWYLLAKPKVLFDYLKGLLGGLGLLVLGAATGLLAFGLGMAGAGFLASKIGLSGGFAIFCAVIGGIVVCQLFFEAVDRLLKSKREDE